MKLNRTIETWDKCDAGAMSLMSQAAIKYAFEDAKQDIKNLAAIQAQLVEALQLSLEEAIYPSRSISRLHDICIVALAAAGAQP